MMQMTKHARVDRTERIDRFNRYFVKDKAYLVASFDCGNYGNSGKYEYHELYSNATVIIYNIKGEVITCKFINLTTLHDRYGKYYWELHEYAKRNSIQGLNH